MIFDEFDDSLDVRPGPFQMSGFSRPFSVGYPRTYENHIVKQRFRPDLRREDIKVRYQEGGVLEIEWPLKANGEEIPVQ